MMRYSCFYQGRVLVRIYFEKVRVGDSDKWVDAQTVKYVAELCSALGV